jgi:hypothetical protein
VRSSAAGAGICLRRRDRLPARCAALRRNVERGPRTAWSASWGVDGFRPPPGLGEEIGLVSTTFPSAPYLFIGSLSGYALGAPTIHAAHGHWRLAAADLGLRVGATIGAIAASLLDATLLARESRPAESAPSPGFVWTPSAGMTRGGATAGVTGVF